MIEIKVNDEIRDVEAQVWMGLTIKQILLILGGILFGVLVGMLLYFKTNVHEMVICYVAIFTVSPFVVSAFLKWHDMSILSFIKTLFKRLKEPSYKSYFDPNEEYLLTIKDKDSNRKEKNKKEESE